MLIEKHNTNFLVYVEGTLSNKISPCQKARHFEKLFKKIHVISNGYMSGIVRIYVCVCVFWCFTSSNTLRTKHFKFKCLSILPMIGAYYKNTLLRTICSSDVTLNIIYKNIQRNFLLYLEGTLCLWIFLLKEKIRRVIHLLKGERDLTPLV